MDITKEPMGAMEAAEPIEGVPQEEPKRIVEQDIVDATQTLREYMAGKANLDARVIDDEKWWKGQHWAAIRKKEKGTGGPEPTSRWLFNAITNKHADIMDNYPEPICLPREKSDTQSAETLSEILPVVFKYNQFEKVYSNNAWEFLKHGTAVYGVFWDSRKDGIGDISIQGIDLLRIYWQPGITDIQDSRNLFILDLVDTDLLQERYPDKKFEGGGITVLNYEFDDNVDTSKKSVVVDWYYKKETPEGRTLLHYVKFAGKNILYASEDDPAYADRGFYDHGKYPVVFSVLYPEKGTPTAFGEIAICRDPQIYIDKLMGNILETSLLNTKRRFFAKRSMNINREQLLDNSEPLIEVDGDIDETRIKEFGTRDLSAIYANIVQMKQEEMKETSSNRDVNSGGSGGGVTAASAIAALQEAGNKNSRDIISGLYRDFVDITHLVLELMRQFYDEPRSFRITNKMAAPEGMPMGAAEYQFAEFSNQMIGDKAVGLDQSGQALYRKPIFDIDVRAQRQNPFSVMAQNELAKELLAMGAFNPQRAQEILGALKMMTFEGKEEVVEYAMQGQTLYNMLMQAQQELMMLKAAMGIPPEAPAPVGGGAPAPQVGGAKTPVTDGVMQAQTPRAPYAESLAKRSTPRV